MDVAQLYMLALRPTMQPIIGESSDNLFLGQIEIESWSWDMHNVEEAARHQREDVDPYSKNKTTLAQAAEKRITADFDKKMKDLKKGFRAEDITRIQDDLRREDERLKKLQIGPSARDLTESDWSRRESLAKQLNNLLNDAGDALEGAGDAIDEEKRRRDRKRGDAEKEISDQRGEALDRARNFEFTFSKRVDVSTTQLLNCMKAGDLLPTVTLTMHQASSNTPWTLVITVTKMRLLDYKLRVEVSDTMTDMREDWTCEFESFGYVYQNRPHAGAKSVTAGNVNTQVARAATQATVRTFMMKNLFFK